MPPSLPLAEGKANPNQRAALGLLEKRGGALGKRVDALRQNKNVKIRTSGAHFQWH